MLTDIKSLFSGKALHKKCLYKTACTNNMRITGIKFTSKNKRTEGTNRPKSRKKNLLAPLLHNDFECLKMKQRIWKKNAWEVHNQVYTVRIWGMRNNIFIWTKKMFHSPWLYTFYTAYTKWISESSFGSKHGRWKMIIVRNWKTSQEE